MTNRQLATLCAACGLLVGAGLLNKNKKAIKRKVSLLGGDRGAFVANAIPVQIDKVLDVGCSYGWTLDALTGKARQLVGIDMDQAALNQAISSYPHIEFIHQSAATLPFGPNEFDVVILSEVIEHVGNENKQLVIDEIHRVLKENGCFILTAPFCGMFAWADPMDFKRRFSHIYRFYMRLSGYIPTTPLEIGHQHVSLKEIEALFDNRFKMERVQYCGLLSPLLTWILAIDSRLHLLPRIFHDKINAFRGWESGISYPRQIAYNIRLRAIKAPGIS